MNQPLRPELPAAPPPPSVRAGTAPAAAPKRNLIGRLIGERYEVTSFIGEGGMGEVYEAEHVAMGRVVAVKVIHPRRAQDREAISRLRREARIAGTLGHPNICAVYDMGRLDDGSPYLIMERLRGETLAQLLKRDGTLAFDDLIDVMAQVMTALSAAHQKGVVHRDMKPDNIFLVRREGMRPTPKLLDFGISKAEDIEETSIDMTGSSHGTAAGTPFYMAPEQARGERKIDHRVDLWAAGVILYECATGQRPFNARNYNALLVQILSSPHRPVHELRPDVPSMLAEIVDKALAKSREDRFQSAADLQNALRAVRPKERAGGPPSRPRPVLAGSPAGGLPEMSAPARTEPLPPEAGVVVPALPAPAPKPPPPVAARRVKPAPSSRSRMPSEPPSDDSDATFVFSRAEMRLARKALEAKKEPFPAGATGGPKPQAITEPFPAGAAGSSKPQAPAEPLRPPLAPLDPPTYSGDGDETQIYTPNKVVDEKTTEDPRFRGAPIPPRRKG